MHPNVQLELFLYKNEILLGVEVLHKSEVYGWIYIQFLNLYACSLIREFLNKLYFISVHYDLYLDFILNTHSTRAVICGHTNVVS
jgi:hypothetical protein